MTNRSRRDILIEVGEAMIADAVSTTATTRVASAQKADSIPPSEWGYRSIKEITGALQTRKISASELVEYTIGRIEALD
jgi:hypothetical protein